MVPKIFQVRFSQILMTMAVISAMFGLAILFTALFNFKQGGLQTTYHVITTSPEQDAALRHIQSEMSDVQARLSAIPSNIPENDALYIELKAEEAKISKLDSRLTSLEEVILTNPTKALQIPLMQRDIQSIRDIQQASEVSLRGDIDRIYDLTKWLLGSLVASTFFYIIGNFIKPKDAKSP